MSTHITIREDRWHVSEFVRIYNSTSEDKQIVVPTSQRDWAWKRNAAGLQKQQKFIDSIMNGYPVPTIILNRSSTHTYEVYDGRHRIETLQEYSLDKFKWDGKLYSDLNVYEKRMFNDRELPVTITDKATPAQLAEAFVRLNSGSPLKDYDKFWARRDRPLMKAVEYHVLDNERLADALGKIDMRKRQDLANWVALVYGLATQNPGNITTSYIRVTEDHTAFGLDMEVDNTYIKSGIDALCTMLELVNLRFTCESEKKKQKLKKVGFVIAFFIAEWMLSSDKDYIIDKWSDIAGKARDDNPSILKKLRVTGAQNLTSDKISKVLKQINNESECEEIDGSIISDDELDI